MNDKIFEFAKTKDALGELSAGLVELENLLKIKQSALAADRQKFDNEIKQKDQQIAKLTEAAQKALVKIENIGKYIEEVL